MKILSHIYSYIFIQSNLNSLQRSIADLGTIKSQKHSFLRKNHIYSLLLHCRNSCLFLLTTLTLFACNNNYDDLKIMIADMNNAQNCNIKKDKDNLYISFQIMGVDSIDFERYTSRTAIASTLFNDSKSYSEIDSFFIDIKTKTKLFHKAYQKKNINKINQCFLTLTPTILMLEKQQYADFLNNTIHKIDNNLIQTLIDGDTQMGKIKKVQIAGFIEKNGSINYIVILTRDNNVHNRLDLKVKLDSCEIVEIDM